MMPLALKPARPYVHLVAAAFAAVNVATIAGAADAGPRGYLFIVGGGPRPAGLMERFVELAGGKGKARIVVLPMASSEPEATGQEQAEEFVALGAQALVLNVSREQAAGAAHSLDDAGGVWFCGGDQSRLTAAIKDTPVEQAIRARYRAGAAVGGTSAGAAVMSDPMITGDERRPGGDRPDKETAFITIERDNVVTIPGFGLLPGTIVDQHFVRRKRNNRLLSLVLENPSLVGVGIDEMTAVEVGPGGRPWRVLGAGQVVIYDARDATVKPNGPRRLAAFGLRLHVLPGGSEYDLRKGRVTLPR